ncbi:helix-turn-helix domain-containing protein [Salmonella enterica]
MNITEKIKAIRKAEGLTQATFCEISKIPLSTLKNYEGGHAEPSVSTLLLITSNPRFKKYALWLTTGEIAPEAGQIAPSSPIDRGIKLRSIRKAEGLTQQQFSDLTGISLGTIRNYEKGQSDVELKTIDMVLSVELFEKYMMWLMKGKTQPGLGQIAPALSLDGCNHSEAVQVSIETAQKSPR